MIYIMSSFIMRKIKRKWGIKMCKDFKVDKVSYEEIVIPPVKPKEVKPASAGLYESEDKMVSHPGHYQSENGLEVIDVIEAFTKDLTGVEATDTGNIIKYACRWHKKNGIQDLEKILWYTSHLIKKLKEKQE